MDTSPTLISTENYIVADFDINQYISIKNQLHDLP